MWMNDRLIAIILTEARWWVDRHCYVHRPTYKCSAVLGSGRRVPLELAIQAVEGTTTTFTNEDTASGHSAKEQNMKPGGWDTERHFFIILADEIKAGSTPYIPNIHSTWNTRVFSVLTHHKLRGCLSCRCIADGRSCTSPTKQRICLQDIGSGQRSTAHLPCVITSLNVWEFYWSYPRQHKVTTINHNRPKTSQRTPNGLKVDCHVWSDSRANK